MDIFYTRDIEGNESEEPSLPSDYSDFEDDNSKADEEPTSGANLDETEQPTSEDSPLEIKVDQALKYFDSINLKVADFLDGLSWGDAACTRNAKIKMERNILFQSPKLLAILKRWATPPRPKSSSKARPKGASAIMNQFTIEHSNKSIENELGRSLPRLRKKLVCGSIPRVRRISRSVFGVAVAVVAKIGMSGGKNARSFPSSL